MALQAARQDAQALRAVEAALAADPTAARRIGLDYLRGHLLLALERRSDALQAFATTLATTPALGAHGRHRLAVEQESLGHPEVAAGLAATLLASKPPRDLIEPSTRLLDRTLEQGGDCRLLRGLRGNDFRPSIRRQLTLATARCALQAQDQERGERLLRSLLETDRSDEVARRAAALLAGRPPAAKERQLHRLIGLTFHEHREFDEAVEHLARALAGDESAVFSHHAIFETRYALARSHFWLARFRQAAAAFGALAADSATPSRRAQVLYQQARCWELAEDWEKAITTYALTAQVEPRGRFADTAHLSQLRLTWRQGDEKAALALYQKLNDEHRFGSVARAALFFASSDVVQDRGDRAGTWLATAARLGRLDEQEVHYWQGRHAALAGRERVAAAHFAQLLRADPFHPLAVDARALLAQPPLAAAARTLAGQLAASEQLDDQVTAWLLYDATPRGEALRARLVARLTNDEAAAPFLQLTAVPIADWPLWEASLREPEEKLLALGIWREGASAVLRHFPVTQPDLAFTGSLRLAEAGAPHRSLYIAEVLARRVPRSVPKPLLPTAYRRLLYPFAYSYLLLRETNRRGIDPYLLAAIIREESRYDHHAFSGASARGLTQFVLPTARRFAVPIGLEALQAEDLERPEIAIALGAAYLEQLAVDFDGDAAAMIAAYNAGEPQAALWRRYCFSDEPAELLAKITFRETRNYVVKVLTSHANYRNLYAPQDASADE